MLHENSGNGTLKGIAFSKNFRFSDYTTYGLGGKAKIAYFPKTEEEAVAVIKFFQESGQKYIVLGGGSNVLAADGYFDGAVISTKYLRGIKENYGSLYCLSGTTVAELLKFCTEKGVGGYEYLAGIPATLGGLTLMNGGIPEKHISQDIISVRLFTDKLLEFSNENCNFGNKHSTMRDINALILGLKLSKNAVPREAVKKNIQKYLLKRSGQPKGKSCGCIFKNPQNQSAGKIIDEAGLKGLKIGGAEISSSHANFIINNGATASDVYRLIQTVKRRVKEFCGVLLEEEVVYIGEFNDFDS